MKVSVCTLCNFVVVIGNLSTFLFFNYFSFSKKKMRKWSECFHSTSIPSWLICSKSLSRLMVASASDLVRRLFRILLALNSEW